MACEGELFKIVADEGDTSIVSVRVRDDDVRNGGVPRFGPCRLEAVAKIMADTTKISWCDEIWNPWLGRSGVRRKTSEANWRKPLTWEAKAEAIQQWCAANTSDVERRPRVFVGSLMDAFEDWEGPIVNAKGRRLCKNHHDGEARISYTDWPANTIPPYGWATMADLRRDMFGVFDQCQNLDFLLLTKRPENIRRFWPMVRPLELPEMPDRDPGELYRQNCWLLYSASDQATLEAGIGSLLECRDLAPVLGLSLEPLVGPVNFRRLSPEIVRWKCDCNAGVAFTGDFFPGRGTSPDDMNDPGWDTCCAKCGCEKSVPLLDWVKIGGESGPHARPMELAWLRDIVEQCQTAGVPCFVTQDSGPKAGQQGRIPDDLWAVKQFPEVKR